MLSPPSKKTNQVIYRCQQPSERSIYDTRKDKKRHRIRRQRSSARSGLTALCTRRRRYVATGGINDSCLYTAHSTKKSSQIIALHAGKKNIKADKLMDYSNNTHLKHLPNQLIIIN